MNAAIVPKSEARQFHDKTGWVLEYGPAYKRRTLLLACVCPLFVFYAIDARQSKVLLYDWGFLVNRWPFRSKRVLWREIVDIRYVGWRRAIIFHLKGGKSVSILSYMDGLGQLQKELDARDVNTSRVPSFFRR